jgi:hypothetical protein
MQSWPCGVTHKVSDYHLYHKWQWLAAANSHWLLQLLIVAVDKLITNLLKVSGKLLYKNPELLPDLQMRGKVRNDTENFKSMKLNQLVHM